VIDSLALLLASDEFIDIQVILTRPTPGIVATHAMDYQLPKIFRVVKPQGDGAVHR
jgi:hypothetical protein